MIEDRALIVAPGQVVKSGYVPIHRIRLACRERMAVGDVDRAYQRALQAAPAQVHPTPNGYWEGETFVVRDGRHTVVALLMLGFDYVLVSWIGEGGSDE